MDHPTVATLAMNRSCQGNAETKKNPARTKKLPRLPRAGRFDSYVRHRTAPSRYERGAAPRDLSRSAISWISDRWASTMPCASRFSTPTAHLSAQPSAM